MQSVTISAGQVNAHHERIRIAIFMAIFLFFWITTNPFIDLVQLQAAGLDGSTGSNVVNQITFLLITSLTIYVALTHPLRAQICQPRLLIIALISWFFISSALSNYPVEGIKRTLD